MSNTGTGERPGRVGRTMLPRKESSRPGVTARGGHRLSRSRRFSAAVGALLVLMACLWLAWLLLQRLAGGLGLATFPLPLPGPGRAPAATATIPVAPLAAAGIALGHPTQVPALNQQQALVLASQLEPDAAAQAKKTLAQYVLLTYTGTGAATAHANLKDVPSWLVLYQQIPLPPSDASADPTPFPQAQHDLYVFLDAHSGKELLVIWI